MEQQISQFHQEFSCSMLGYGVYQMFIIYSLNITIYFQMKAQYNAIAPSNSHQNLNLQYFHPLSPFHKISTPHRARINTSVSSTYASPINFLSALNNCKTQSDKENAACLLNQSPILNKFNMDPSNKSDDKKRSPIPRMTKKLCFQTTYIANQPETQQYSNFEERLKSPRYHLQNIKRVAKTKSNNFRDILQAQQYQIKVREVQDKNPQGNLKKSFSTCRYNQQLFNSCFQPSQKIGSDQQHQSRDSKIWACQNNDGNSAKYMTISQDDDESLYYCSKCTVLLVNQGFILEEINKSHNQNGNTFINESASTIYSKIQASKDKLNSLINDLLMRQQFETDRLRQYYEHLSNGLTKCRMENESSLKRWYQQKIQNYQSVLHQIQVFGEEITQNGQNHQQFESLHSQIFRTKLGDPFLKKYEPEKMKNLEQLFCQNMNQNFRLNSQNNCISQKQSKLHQRQGLASRNHGLRFSFQKLLNDISSKKSKMQNMINTLEEQAEEEIDVVNNCTEQIRRTPFRDLFPEGDNSYQINNSVNSPTFKHF